MKKNQGKKNQLDPNLSRDRILDLDQNPDPGHGLVPSPVATNNVPCFLGMYYPVTQLSYDVATLHKITFVSYPVSRQLILLKHNIENLIQKSPLC